MICYSSLQHKILNNKYMRVVIIGAGRMGIRHAQGIEPMSEISEICLVDISENALNTASKTFEKSNKVKYILVSDFYDSLETYDTAIIASTAGNRLEILSEVLQKGVKYVLLEKPLGQSLQEVKEIAEYLKQYPNVKSFVNFSMRLSPSLLQLKKDFSAQPQMTGAKTITINNGAIGIGANGIHLIDMCFFLLDANKAIIVAAEVEETTISSGRGEQFCDFGGWAVINFYNNDIFLGKLLISISSTSTPVGPIEIVGSNGRICYDEVRGVRIDSFRKEESQLAVYRYHGDYLPDSKKELTSLSLPELTHFWLENVIKKNDVLPSVEDSIKVHELLFNWLSKSKTHSKSYPIT